MRAGALLTAIVGAWLCVGAGVSVAAPAVETVTVSDIAISPARFNGQRLRVKGVMIDGWAICSPLLKSDAGHIENYGAAHCIDLRKIDPWEAQAERYQGAEVLLDAIYWNRCLPEVRAVEPSYIHENCDSSRNGTLGPLDVQIVGYIDLREPTSGDVALREIDLGGPEAAGLQPFVQTFVAAAAARDVNALVALFDLRDRGWMRVWLKVPTSREAWLYFAPEMRPRSAVPVAGYRLFAPANSAPHVCFCRMASCEGRWPRWSREISAEQSINVPTVCFPVRRAKGETWQLN